jgi:hypothetical protein
MEEADPALSDSSESSGDGFEDIYGPDLMGDEEDRRRLIATCLFTLHNLTLF